MKEEKEIARFDAKMPKDKKMYFKKAATIGGFSTLSQFIIEAADHYAKSIIDKHNLILSTRNDQIKFIDALDKEEKANQFPELDNMLKNYKALFKKQ